MSASIAVSKDKAIRKTGRSVDIAIGLLSTLGRCARPAVRCIAAFVAGTKQVAHAHLDPYLFQIVPDHRKAFIFKEARRSTRGQPQQRRSRS